jgi:hypothetical protein
VPAKELRRELINRSFGPPKKSCLAQPVCRLRIIRQDHPSPTDGEVLSILKADAPEGSGLVHPSLKAAGAIDDRVWFEAMNSLPLEILKENLAAGMPNHHGHSDKGPLGEDHLRNPAIAAAEKEGCGACIDRYPTRSSGVACHSVFEISDDLAM